MVSQMFTTIEQAITGFTSALGASISGITDLFYVEGENGGFTVLGVLLLIAVGVGVVYWAFRLIRGLVSQRRA